mmetsp:Transcript_46274/g.83399  ORF Transcript_46274/g.83399 Transcript_46274/m.83399 type:complete len:218 (+) Transcript_46274:1353-2006(+)
METSKVGSPDSCQKHHKIGRRPRRFPNLHPLLQTGLQGRWKGLLLLETVQVANLSHLAARQWRDLPFLVLAAEKLRMVFLVRLPCQTVLHRPLKCRVVLRLQLIQRDPARYNSRRRCRNSPCNHSSTSNKVMCNSSKQIRPCNYSSCLRRYLQAALEMLPSRFDGRHCHWKVTTCQVQHIDLLPKRVCAHLHRCGFLGCLQRATTWPPQLQVRSVQV